MLNINDSCLDSSFLCHGPVAWEPAPFGTWSRTQVSSLKEPWVSKELQELSHLPCCCIWTLKRLNTTCWKSHRGLIWALKNPADPAINPLYLSRTGNKERTRPSESLCQDGGAEWVELWRVLMMFIGMAVCQHCKLTLSVVQAFCIVACYTQCPTCQIQNGLWRVASAPYGSIIHLTMLNSGMARCLVLEWRCSFRDCSTRCSALPWVNMSTLGLGKNRTELQLRNTLRKVDSTAIRDHWDLAVACSLAEFILTNSVSPKILLSGLHFALGQRFSTFWMLQPFNKFFMLWPPPPILKLFSMVLHDCNFATIRNCYVKIFSDSLRWPLWKGCSTPKMVMTHTQVENLPLP